MAVEDRRNVVSVVEETHALIGNSLATDVPPFLVIRREVVDPLQRLLAEPLIDNQEMVALMRASYFSIDQQRGDHPRTAARAARRDSGRTACRRRLGRATSGGKSRWLQTRTRGSVGANRTPATQALVSSRCEVGRHRARQPFLRPNRGSRGRAAQGVQGVRRNAGRARI